ncbi:MAG: hypothetical protein ACE5I1_07490 [bacterium]
MHEMTAIRQVEKLHHNLLKKYPGNFTIFDVLENQAQTLRKEHQRQNPAVCVQISNWHPRLVGATTDEILQAAFTPEDARVTIAREHGFQNWKQVEARGATQLDKSFEHAVDAVVSGEIDKLEVLLGESSYLARQISQYGHRATLLHYVAANGVETWRQKVPPNAVEITRLLLEAGADVHAKAHVYGGQYDTMALLMSSAHPAEAGLTDRIAAVLKQAKNDVGE